MLALGLGACCCAGVLPAARPSTMGIALSTGRVASVAYGEAEVLVLDEVDALGEESCAQVGHYLIDTTLEAHLRPLIDATAVAFRVGRRLLWGNVAASLAVAFRTMEPYHGQLARSLASWCLKKGPSELEGQGAFWSLEHGSRRGWFWERHNSAPTSAFRSTSAAATAPARLRR